MLCTLYHAQLKNGRVQSLIFQMSEVRLRKHVSDVFEATPLGVTF